MGIAASSAEHGTHPLMIMPAADFETLSMRGHSKSGIATTADPSVGNDKNFGQPEPCCIRNVWRLSGAIDTRNFCRDEVPSRRTLRRLAALMRPEIHGAGRHSSSNNRPL